MESRRKSSGIVGKVVAIALLLAAIATIGRFGGASYLARQAARDHLAQVDAQKPTALLQLRAADRAALAAGPIPIDEAIHLLATRGRMGLGSALEPRPSGDQAPLMGWTYTTRDVPDWMLAPPADAGADAH